MSTGLRCHHSIASLETAMSGKCAIPFLVRNGTVLPEQEYCCSCGTTGGVNAFSHTSQDLVYQLPSHIYPTASYSSSQALQDRRSSVSQPNSPSSSPIDPAVSWSSRDSCRTRFILSCCHVPSCICIRVLQYHHHTVPHSSCCTFIILYCSAFFLANLGWSISGE